MSFYQHHHNWQQQQKRAGQGTPNRYEASPGRNAKWLRCCQCAPRGRDTGRWRQLLCLDDKRCNSCFLSRTHLPLPFLFPRRRNSQEAGKGVLLLKCLCQGEEDDERRRGISWALAAQDSPSFSLHHIEMEMSLHPQLRNAHQGGEKGEEKPRWVFSLQRKAAPPPGAEEKASSLGIREEKGGRAWREDRVGWHQSWQEGNLGSRNVPLEGTVPTEPRGEERPAPPHQPLSPQRPARWGRAPRPPAAVGV